MADSSWPIVSLRLQPDSLCWARLRPVGSLFSATRVNVRQSDVHVEFNYCGYDITVACDRDIGMVDSRSVPSGP